MVFRFSAMGDVAMTVPVLKAVLEQNPSLEIVMVSRAFYAPFFKDLPRTKFVGINLKTDYKGLPGIFRLFKKLRTEQPDAIADLHDVLRTKILNLFFKISGFKVAVIRKGRKEKRALTQQKNKVFIPLKSTHERYADVFRTLGYKVDLNKNLPVPKPVLSKPVELFLQTFAGQPVIGIAPFAAHEGKQYPLEKLRKVLEIVLEKHPEVNILLFGGGEKEKKALEGLEKINRNRIVNLVGVFNFDEELQLISRLKLMLSMDSGNGHLAALYQVPVVTIWGATHPYAGFAPFQQPADYQLIPDRDKFPQLPTSVYGNKVFPGFEAVWDTITPEKISDKILNILQS